jgi:hypothetical protein
MAGHSRIGPRAVTIRYQCESATRTFWHARPKNKGEVIPQGASSGNTSAHGIVKPAPGGRRGAAAEAEAQGEAIERAGIDEPVSHATAQAEIETTATAARAEVEDADLEIWAAWQNSRQLRQSVTSPRCRRLLVVLACGWAGGVDFG